MRIGCVKYLNARPLIRGWPGAVDFDHPAALCQKLARGDLDLALVSSLEYLRRPIYRIVDGVSISSDGAVYSVIVAHQNELSRVEEIALDPASETSVSLLKLLLAHRGLNPRLVASWHRQPADELIEKYPQHAETTAQLLIGDQAIRFRESHPEFHFWDLGQEWKKIVDLPFVYALWLVTPGFANAKKIADRLRSLRDENLAGIDQLIAEEKEFGAEFCRRYYRQHLRFSFGERERQGLLTFADVCAKHGFISKGQLELDLV